MEKFYWYKAVRGKEISTLTVGIRSGTLEIAKKAVFHPAVRPLIRTFPKGVRGEVGEAILRLQKGALLTLPISRPMRQVGRGVDELRIKDASGTYRVFYLARFEDKILVFHAFQKKSRKTPKREMETGKRRLKELLNAQD